MKCELCQREFNSQKGLSSHLRQAHNIITLQDYKKYYDNYILKDIDITCPICKKFPRKFYSFSDGYTKTCIDQVNPDTGKKLQCRFIWNNLDKEKLSEAQIKNTKKMKETIDPVTGKSVYQLKQDKWFNTMSQKNEEGLNKFEQFGPKVSDHHLSIDPVTGKTFGQLTSQRAAETRKNTKVGDKTLAEICAIKAAKTVDNTIMEDGRTQKEHMTERAIITRRDTIRPNGLSIIRDTARISYETKKKNGTLPKYYGYSKISEKIFEKLIEDFKLSKTLCFYAENEYTFIDKNSGEDFRYDFTYLVNNEPLIIIEFHGNKFHIRESELEFRKDDTNPYGAPLLEGYYKDLLKKKNIKNYLNCNFFEIWEDTKDKDIQIIYEKLKNILSN